MTDSLDRARAARMAAARALQVVVHEAVTSGNPFVARETAERLVDNIIVCVLETIDACFEEEEPNDNVHITRPN